MTKLGKLLFGIVIIILLAGTIFLLGKKEPVIAPIPASEINSPLLSDTNVAPEVMSNKDGISTTLPPIPLGPNDPVFNVVKPELGKIFKIGSTHIIEWDLRNMPNAATATIELGSYDKETISRLISFGVGVFEGKTPNAFGIVANRINPQQKSFIWNVSTNLTKSSRSCEDRICGDISAISLSSRKFIILITIYDSTGSRISTSVSLPFYITQ